MFMLSNYMNSSGTSDDAILSATILALVLVSGASSITSNINLYTLNSQFLKSWASE
jgi:hypothetical protein